MAFLNFLLKRKIVPLREKQEAAITNLCMTGLIWLVYQGAVLLFGAAVVVAEPRMPAEEALKAAFVYNFLKFVEWPQASHTGRTVNLCIVGNSPVIVFLKSLDGKDIRGKQLRVTSGHVLTGLNNCHAVLITGSNDAENVEKLLQRLGSEHVLTISDTEDFTYQGGMIELFKQDNKIRFKINLKATMAAKLKLSSRLLKLAQKIEK